MYLTDGQSPFLSWFRNLGSARASELILQFHSGWGSWRYSSASAWLLKDDLKRLDGFYCRCLRAILGVKASFYSRDSNQTVLQRAGCKEVSSLIRQSQLALLGQVLEDESKRVLRKVAFHGESDDPETAFWVRRRGRPRQNWTERLSDREQVIKQAPDGPLAR